MNWEQSLHSNYTGPTADLNNGTASNSTAHNASDLQSDEIWAKRMEYIYYYGISMVIVFYLAFQRTALFFQTCIHASRNLHELLYTGITRSPMEFFNKNSSGRILNRFSNDIGSIDTLLPLAAGDAILVSSNFIFAMSVHASSQAIEWHRPLLIILLNHFLFQFILEFLAIVFLVVLVNIWLIVPTILMLLMFGLLRLVYIKAARCMKRIESMSKLIVCANTKIAYLERLQTVSAY